MSTAAQAWIDERHERAATSAVPRSEGRRGGRPSAAERARPRRRNPGGERSGSAQEQSWNVLAEQVIAYPPAHDRLFADPPLVEDKGRAATSRAAGLVSYGEAWLEQEHLRLRVRTTLALSETAGRPASPDRSERARREPLPAPGDELRRAAVTGHASCGTPGSIPRAGGCGYVQTATARRRLRRAAAVRPEPRGWRRLLPGVATLAALVGLWFGTGLLSGIHRPAYRVVPGSVRVARGYFYVARPGDTVWSIAASVQPGGDPRPLVDRLEAELGGRILQPGDRLLLP